jgi:hypothetical protein
MTEMFYNAADFNQPLNSWNITTNNTSNIFNLTNMDPLNYPPNPNYTLIEDDEGEDDNYTNPYNITFDPYFLSFNKSIQPDKIPIENSIIQITESDMVIDYISGDDLSVKHLLHTPDNIVFYYKGSPSFYITRQQMLSNVPSTLRFGCHNISTISHVPNIQNLENTAYISLRPIGFPMGEGIIPLFLLNNALYPETPKSFCLEIIETNKIFPSVTSIQMLSPQPNAVSAAHCQEGQEQRVYSLKLITLFVEIKKRDNLQQTAGKRYTKKKKNKNKNKNTYKTTHRRNTRYL